jgi:hypothetical protein
MIELLTALTIKHFIVDFPLQPKYMYSNKGTYAHFGGILHAGLHGLGTYICLIIFAPEYAIYLAILDMCVHYHIDWAKMNLNKKLGWGPTTHEQFWWLMGFDQLLHSLTYVLIITLAIK